MRYPGKTRWGRAATLASPCGTGSVHRLLTCSCAHVRGRRHPVDWHERTGHRTRGQERWREQRWLPGARNVLLLAASLSEHEDHQRPQGCCSWWEAGVTGRSQKSVCWDRRKETGRAEAEWSEQLSGAGSWAKNKDREPVRQLWKKAIQGKGQRLAETGGAPGTSEEQGEPCKEAPGGRRRQRGQGEGWDLTDHARGHCEGVPAGRRSDSTLKGLFSCTRPGLLGDRVGASWWEAMALIQARKGRRWLRRRGREQCLNSRYVHSEGRAKRTCGQDECRRREEEGNLGLQGFLLPGTAGDCC